MEVTSPLYIAAESRHVDAVHCLLMKGANASGSPDMILKPIHGACWANCSEAVLLLLGHGATLSKGEWLGQLVLARTRRYHALEVLCRIMYLASKEE